MKHKLTIICLGVVFVFGGLPQDTTAQEKGIEVFTCNALVTASPASGKTTRFTITIDEYTSDEDNLKYLNLLKAEGQEGLREALEEVEVGWIAPRGQTREIINFARSRKVEGYMFAGMKVEISAENQLVMEQRTNAPIRLQRVKLLK